MLALKILSKPNNCDTEQPVVDIAVLSKYLSISSGAAQATLQLDKKN
ncbi:hypothetical protein [Nostoc sp.]